MKRPWKNIKGLFSPDSRKVLKKQEKIFSAVWTPYSADFTKIDDDLFDELEESLIMADLGVDTTSK